MQVPFGGTRAIRACEQRVREPSRQPGRTGRIIRGDPLAQRGEERRPRIGVIAFDRLHGRDGGIQLGPFDAPGLPGFGQGRDVAPVVEPGRVHEEELIDAPWLCDHDVVLPLTIIVEMCHATSLVA